MNALNASRSTPKNKQLTSARSIQQDAGCYLALKGVVGSTASSANAFDCNDGTQSFAVCTGPAVSLVKLENGRVVTQRFFRANPEASPASTAAASSYYPGRPPSTPEQRSRSTSLAKDWGSGGPSSARRLLDSPNKAKLNIRTRDSACVALSPDGKLLAIGETGFNPRILIFFTAVGMNETPASILNEHSFGVRAVAFSPDSRWLCSIGDLHDGFIYIWSVNPKTGSVSLQYCNKCISYVQNIAWVGQSIITVGTRHVKTWRPPAQAPMSSPSKVRFESERALISPRESPVPKTLSGRNCLLGSMIDSSFTCVVSLSFTKAALCTDQGDVCACLLDDADPSQRDIRKVAKVAFSVSCMRVDTTNDLLWLGGKKGKLAALGLKAFEALDAAAWHVMSPTYHESWSAPQSDPSFDLVAVGLVQDQIILVQSNHVMKIGKVDSHNCTPMLEEDSITFPAHDSAVVGVGAIRTEALNGDFFTYSSSGAIMLWSIDGGCNGVLRIMLGQPMVEEGYEGPNELKVVKISSSGDCFLSGDRLGCLRLTGCDSKESPFSKAHNGEVTDIDTVQEDSGTTLIVSSGRDRSLQLFRRAQERLHLLQTMLDHTGSVVACRFFRNGSTLLSSSADRTINIRSVALGAEKSSIAYVTTRVIALKSTPIALSSIPDDPRTLAVSTIDKQIQTYDVESGLLKNYFKPQDTPGGDLATVTCVSTHKFQGASFGTVLAGLSSTDKSIRLYSLETGSLLNKEHAQTGISGIAFCQQASSNIESGTFIVSAGLDGTIMIWSIETPSSCLLESPERAGGEPHKMNNVPLRKVLSKSNLLDLQRTVETSPSRVRRKTSRYTLAPGSKPSNALASPTPGGRRGEHAQPLASHGEKAYARRTSRRLSLDGGDRPKTNNNLTALEPSIENLCQSLRSFRKRFLATAGSLESSTTRELEQELDQTRYALSGQKKPSPDVAQNDLFDAYLARMIDERLAIKAGTQSPQSTNHEVSTAPQQEGQSVAGS